MISLSVRLLLVIFAGSFGRGPGTADKADLSPEIAESDFRAIVDYIASDKCAGRLTGTAGAERAAEYIAAVFEKAGLQTLQGADGYYQPFEFTAGTRLVDGKNHMDVRTNGEPRSCTLNQDFVPLTFSDNAAIEGEVVFVGYGLVEPQSHGKGYDSYQGTDVEGKIVLALRDIPEQVSPKRRQELSLYAGDRYKAKQAAERGAKAFLLVTGPNSSNGGEVIKFRTASRTASAGIAAASISGALAERLLEPADLKLRELQDALDGGDLPPHPPGLKDAHVRLEIALERVQKTCRNVLGALEPHGTDEYVIVGAHYDHIGSGEMGDSLARKEERGQVHNGADDNASGTSVVLELAAQLAQQHSKDEKSARRGIIFACWSGEELGLVGSSEFVKDPPAPMDKVAAYINFDMVGRLRDNKLIVQAVGSSPAWRAIIERRNIPAGFSLTLQDDPYLPTDATAFYTKGVPALSFFTDLHDDYNRPTDDPQTLNYQGLERIARFAELIVKDAVRVDFEIDYARVERTSQPSARMGRRVYTGTVPDFTGGDDDGLVISDVSPGGPADKAGLKGGDRIVEFAGITIANLQDYSDVLIGAKVGETVPIVVVRDGERLTLQITPTARPQ